MTPVILSVSAVLLNIIMQNFPSPGFSIGVRRADAPPAETPYRPSLTCFSFRGQSLSLTQREFRLRWAYSPRLTRVGPRPPSARPSALSGLPGASGPDPPSYGDAVTAAFSIGNKVSTSCSCRPGPGLGSWQPIGREHGAQAAAAGRGRPSCQPEHQPY